MAGLGLYLLPALVIILDEQLFKTHWIAHHLPPGLGRIFCAVYPWLCRMFGG